MDSERTAATAGVAACLATAVAVAAPYFLLPAEEASAVGAYYDIGVVTPLAVGLLGLLGAVIFAAGREHRSDPDLVAGVMLVVGLFSLAAAAEWALAFRPDLVGSRPALELFSTHRWSVLAGGVAETAAALWYATARRLVPVPSLLAPGRS